MRVVTFCSATLRRRLAPAAGRGLQIEFRSPRPTQKSTADLGDCDAALVELTTRAGKATLAHLRRAAPGCLIGSISLRNSGALIDRSRRLGFDFHLGSWRVGEPAGGELRARIEAARMAPASSGVYEKRLGILTDIVKTANSILEPRKVIELVMENIRQLIPSEAWSLLLLDEERMQLVFEMALGDHSSAIQSERIELGEGVAGWVAQHGEPTIINDVRRDRRFAARFDAESQFQTRSILCAPLVSRGRTIGVVQVLNRVGGPFTRADLKLVMMLVEPAAIAIENAFLFQKAERLTITDDLTKLYNSRYLNLYLQRELKRCKRNNIPLSLMFLDLDGFKGVNDRHGHLAGSGTLTEVGNILLDTVRDSDIVARYGGDEFVVVLPETPTEGALVIAERIRQNIEAHEFLKEQGVCARISASFGVATYPDHAPSVEVLIQKADQAMYRVKGREKNDVEVAS